MNNSDEKRLLVKRNRGKFGMYYLTALSPGDLSEIRDESFDLPFLHPRHDIFFNSCGGLLCIYEVSGHIYLCNPTTKQFQMFPTKEAPPDNKMGTSLVGGFVCYDSKSDDYKILRVCQRIYPAPYYRTYETFELYSLRNDSWKEVRGPMPSNYLEATYISHINATYVRGKCYWFDGGDVVASFDCIEESFSYFRLPPKSRHFHCDLVQFNGGDSLGLLRVRKRGGAPPLYLGIEPGNYYELWVWREELWCWDRMFNVSLGGAVGGAQGTICGTFLFLCGMAGRSDEDKHRLVVYDWNKKECKELGIDNYHFEIDVFCYVESTVALPHGKPIYGSHTLNYPPLDKDDHDDYEDEDEDEDEYEYEEYFKSSCAELYDKAYKSNVDDFIVNGFRVLNDIEEEEEEEVATNGNMPYVYCYSPVYVYGQSSFNPYNPSFIDTGGSYNKADGHNVALNTPNSSLTAMGAASGAKILSEGRVNMGTGKQHPASSITSGSNCITSQAAPTPQIRGPQGMENGLRGKASAVSSQLKTAFTSGNGSSSFESSNYSPAYVNNVKPNMLSGSASNDERVDPDKSKKQLAVKHCTTRDEKPDAQRNIIISIDQYNRVDFPVEYAKAKFFVIKSRSEDDVHKSIKYNMWSPTPIGSKKLAVAYEDAKRMAAGDSRGCPIFLFFSVNASGRFCGIAEMTGPVDLHRDMDFCLQDRWILSFSVKWHIIKDLSNPNFRHIILENNENTLVTNCRGTQEISFENGLEMLKIFRGYTSKTSLLDGFNRQWILQRDREARLHSVDELKISGLNICSDELGSGHTTAVSNKTNSEMVNVVLIGSIPVSLVGTTPLDPRTLLHEQVEGNSASEEVYDV